MTPAKADYSPAPVAPPAATIPDSTPGESAGTTALSGLTGLSALAGGLDTGELTGVLGTIVGLSPLGRLKLRDIDSPLAPLLKRLDLGIDLRAEMTTRAEDTLSLEEH